jgi:hypothetical protein
MGVSKYVSRRANGRFITEKMSAAPEMLIRILKEERVD